MTLLSSFEAVHYRGIDGLSLPQLSRANLVTGVNGVGKTALIEAMWLFVGRYNPMLLWNGNVLRTGNRTLDPISRLSSGELELHGTESGASCQLKAAFAHNSDPTHPVKIPGTAEEPPRQVPLVGRIETRIDGKLIEGNPGGVATDWGMVVHQNPTTPTNRPNCVIETIEFQFQSSDEYLQRYSNMVREGRKGALTDAINLMFPKIKDVEILTDKAGESYLSTLTRDGNQLSLHDHGGGIVRLCRLLLDFFASRDGLLLVDELENGIHHSILSQVWGCVHQWMTDWNVQFMATTHSDECVKAAIEAFSDTPDDLSIHKLFINQAGQTEAVTFTGDTLDGVLDLNLEIR